MSELLASRYQLVEVIGEGAMGVIWRAYDTLLDRHVAIKEMRPRPGPDREEALKRFMVEARAAARLTHPNIVAVHDVLADADRVVIAMELLSGGTLARLVAEQGAQPPPTVRAIMAQVAQGLSAAHTAGIVHRDLKPDNIFWTTEGRAVVADFGLARVGGGLGTVDGTILGTSGYMAPEQVRGLRAGPGVDIFAWGVVARTLATGTAPFGGSETDDPAALLYRIVHETLPSLKLSGDSDLAVLVDQCMAKEPEHRPADGRELVARLALGAGGGGGGAGARAGHEALNPVPTPAAFAAPPRRLLGAAPVVAAVVALIVILGGAVFAATRDSGPEAASAPTSTAATVTTAMATTTMATPTMPPTTMASTTVAPAPRPFPSGVGAIDSGSWAPTQFRPRISFRLGDGWETDSPGETADHLFLIRGAPATSTYPWLLFLDVHRTSDYQDPLRPPRPGTGDALEWLRQHPRLSVLQVANASVAGRPGMVIDVVVASGYQSTACVRSCVVLFRLDSNDNVRLHVGERLRMYVVDAADRQLVIIIEAPAEGFDTIARPAEAVVQSVRLL